MSEIKSTGKVCPRNIRGTSFNHNTGVSEHLDLFCGTWCPLCVCSVDGKQMVFDVYCGCEPIRIQEVKP